MLTPQNTQVALVMKQLVVMELQAWTSPIVLVGLPGKKALEEASADPEGGTPDNSMLKRLWSISMSRNKSFRRLGNEEMGSSTDKNESSSRIGVYC